ncbi:potassium transporter Kup [Corynebacterium flavescens]|uniref:potassium transporter Kup n=1 Tax=Corynebacterium flavescens TaxID=28028 RepID=UPI002647DC73|nr:KUP/HAK/KT family potassium transporter [Corynebacterium flavescens]MDN6431448.1 KUP/HAK/KT family potassium transporter [Corynebacterium flavescens]MDN6475156.1 KUP/HAK/KT family potassium transporter [Corynebacterium flavescens]MDN6601213.1 KUP/HAK/KT family potassium transporter [Corynebacterium flavescens]MDN6822694.1 KUP/HAK/KT family potassium transporter [Corynebacterium flavescens]
MKISVSPQAAAKGGSPLLALGALGVVFGDIGTSPLYALHTAFSMEHNAVEVDTRNVYGVISMVLWTITVIVTVKYVLLVTRADNDGQGGILALVALLRRHLKGRHRLGMLVTVCGMIGAALFIGDAVITPAISVLSAVEGMAVVSPDLHHYVVPVAIVVLSALFLIQPFGTGKVGRAFGPIMLAWFITMAVLGVPQIVAHPAILASLSPHWALSLLLREPLEAFILMGAIVLTVTGAEALYADLGHFGATAIRSAWFWVAMPSLMVVYLGQGALVISHPAAVSNPLFHLAPPSLQIPLVVFATVATIIASQAVISGAFAVIRQAVRLNLLPRMTVRHTSTSEEGQIYLPLVNALIYCGVVALILIFRSSERLAEAYGLAVTGTLVLESLLFLLFAHLAWGWRWRAVGCYVLAIGSLELLLLAANSTKIFVGGWLPIGMAGLIFLLMVIWRRGSRRLLKRRGELEGMLPEFIAALPERNIRRIAGTAVYTHPNPETTPLALVRCVEDFHVLHEHVLIVRLVAMNVPHVPPVERISVDNLSSIREGIVHVTVRAGFADDQDIPANLRYGLSQHPELDVDLDSALYFLSVLTLRPAEVRHWNQWHQRLFLSMDRNQAKRTEAFHLPPRQTVVLGSELHL